jgi:DNA-binding LacI/PurR family transcriptional regulator
LAARDRPDAIFCANDSMACATIDVARREFGIAVGSALSVVGFDDERMAAWPGFSVTTYMLPIALLVDEVINLLRRMWANAGHTEAVIVPGKLIVRGSARLPPTG